MNAKQNCAKAALKKSIPSMVRQAKYERNQTLTSHAELVEGFNQRFPNALCANLNLNLMLR